MAENVCFADAEVDTQLDAACQSVWVNVRTRGSWRCSTKRKTQHVLGKRARQLILNIQEELKYYNGSVPAHKADQWPYVTLCNDLQQWVLTSRLGLCVGKVDQQSEDFEVTHGRNYFLTFKLNFSSDTYLEWRAEMLKFLEPHPKDVFHTKVRLAKTSALTR